LFALWQATWRRDPGELTRVSREGGRKEGAPIFPRVYTVAARCRKRVEEKRKKKEGKRKEKGPAVSVGVAWFYTRGCRAHRGGKKGEVAERATQVFTHSSCQSGGSHGGGKKKKEKKGSWRFIPRVNLHELYVGELQGRMRKKKGPRHAPHGI